MVKTFKFGQLLPREDICNRQEEIRVLTGICKTGGRAVVYGPRRFGKTSVVKNIIMEDFLSGNKKSIAIYADLFQLDSAEDLNSRFQVAFEQALSHRAKIKALFQSIHNYLKHFRVELSADPLSGAPTVTFSGQHLKSEKTLSELFSALKNLSKEYKTLLILDEFQDIKHVPGMEARLRSEIQDLTRTAVVLLGSKKHVLREIFNDESKPFYGFGVDVEFRKIPASEWLPYMRERFGPNRLEIREEGVLEILTLMRDVPNAVQELCQWIALRGETGLLSPPRIHKNLSGLVENKSSRYLERLAVLSVKEKKVLIAVARHEPVSSITSTKFLHATQVSATATKATIGRLTDYGILDHSDEGCWITDPLLRCFLVWQFGASAA